MTSKTLHSSGVQQHIHTATVQVL